MGPYFQKINKIAEPIKLPTKPPKTSQQWRMVCNKPIKEIAMPKRINAAFANGTS
jgi:hypothetical protein